MFCDAILLHFNSFNTWNINVMWLRERHFVITRSDRQQQDQNNASPLLQFILTSYSLKKGGTLFPVQKLNMRIWTPLPGFDDLNQWVGFLDLQWWHAVLRECQNYSLGKLKYHTWFPCCHIVNWLTIYNFVFFSLASSSININISHVHFGQMNSDGCRFCNTKSATHSKTLEKR